MAKKTLLNKHIGVLMGGWSPEREISLKSGKMVSEALKRQGFQVTEIDVDRNIAEMLKIKEIDIAFIVLHGVPGEDGTIQGLLEILGIPYTGSGVLASSISMNKIITKKILQSSGIPVPKYFHGNINLDTIKKVIGELPYVVKPVASGSSIGVHIIRNIKDLEDTFYKVKKEHTDAFVEEFIDGMDVTCGILCGEPLPLLELVSRREFYDYKAKYTKGLTEFIIPARLDADVYKKTQEIAFMTHKIIGCKGFSRVDMMVSAQGRSASGGKEKNIYVLEINSIPGMMELSDLPAEAKHIGISYDEVVRRILEEAHSRI